MLGIFIEKTEMYRVSGLVTKVQKKNERKKRRKVSEGDLPPGSVSASDRQDPMALHPPMGDDPPPHGMIALPLSAILLLILSLYSLPESDDDGGVIFFLFPSSPSLPVLRRFFRGKTPS